MTTSGTPDPHQQPGGYPSQPGGYPSPAPGEGYPAAPVYGAPPAGPTYGAPAYGVPAYGAPANGAPGPTNQVPPSGDPNGSPLPGAPGGHRGADFPPPPAGPAKRSEKGLIIGIVAVVVIAIVGVTVLVQQKTDTTAASVGSCIKITSATTTNPDTSQEDCSSRAAVFVVTETGGSDVKCDANEASYVQGSDTNNPSSRVCLRYNLKVGECIDLGLLSSSVPKKVTCSASTTTTTVKLASLAMDSSDESRCTGDTKGLPLVKRNIVYCFGPSS